MSFESSMTTLVRSGLILVFNEDRLDPVATAGALTEAGVGTMELTCRISRPLDQLRRLRSEMPGFLVGVASLIDEEGALRRVNHTRRDDPVPSVAQAVDGGAGYLVSAAGFRDWTYAKYSRKLPMIPGCGTVSEIVHQFGRGAALVKVFPARELGGPAFLKAIDPAIHKSASLIPMGGTSEANIPDYVAAGVIVLGGSFSMIDKAVYADILARQDYKRLAGEFRRIKGVVDAARAKQYPKLDWASAPLDQVIAATGRDLLVR